MALSYENSTPEWDEVLNYINYVFTTVFLCEAVLKLIAYGRSYFKNTWNKFDFMVVVSSLIDVAMDMLNSSAAQFLRVGPQIARVLRVLRVSRILRLIGKYEGLQALISTITFSLPSLGNVFLLLNLIFFMFSILGVFAFN